MILADLRLRLQVAVPLAWLLMCGCGQQDPAGARTAIQAGSQASDLNFPETAEEIVSKTCSIGAKPKVAVEVFLGPIEIVAGNDETIHVTVTKRAGGKTKEAAQATLKEISLTVDEKPDGIRIVAEPPRGKPFSGGVGAKLEVPQGARLDLKTNLDRIAVAGIHGAVRAQNSQGPIIVKGARGAQNLTTNLAGIEVEGPSDQINATNSQGGIIVRGAKGTIELSTSLAEVDVDAPVTKAMIKNSQGPISIRNATGTLDLSTNLATIDVNAPCTQVTAKNSQGPITVTGAKGPVKLTTNLGDIVISGAGKDVEAVNSQGGIAIQGATGRIKAKTSMAQLTVEARDAVIDAENSQGGVTFSGSLASGKHSFKASLGNISLTLPAQASFQIDATASLGTIANAFPLAKTEKSTDTRLVGTVGAKPKTTIQANVDQGSVTIEKGK